MCTSTSARTPHFVVTARTAASEIIALGKCGERRHFRHCPSGVCRRFWRGLRSRWSELQNFKLPRLDKVSKLLLHGRDVKLRVSCRLIVFDIIPIIPGMVLVSLDTAVPLRCFSRCTYLLLH